ncbi:MAG: hypothetical protein KDE19_00055, partial [Caldilineaceae bacterium]|nr:hypothetical protein [Caldilineaceae bacterium]
DRALILSGASYPSTQAMLYQPLIEMLRPLLQQVDIVQKVAAVWLGEAARLFPELRAWRPELPLLQTENHDAARSHLFEALCQLIAAFAGAARSIILCLDDLH